MRSPRGSYALALLGLAILTHLGVSLHFALANHGWCAEHGGFAHHDEHPSGSAAQRGDPLIGGWLAHPVDRGHHHCECLTKREELGLPHLGLALHAGPPPAPDGLSLGLATPTRGVPVYMVAPKASPPA